MVTLSKVILSSQVCKKLSVHLLKPTSTYKGCQVVMSVQCFEMFWSRFHARALKIEKCRSYQDKHELKLYLLEWPTADEAATKAKMPTGIFANRRRSMTRKQKPENPTSSGSGSNRDFLGSWGELV